MQPKYGSTCLYDQNCGIQSADRQKHTQTDRKVKTEGPHILSNDIFYFKTVIIGFPNTTKKNKKRKQTPLKKQDEKNNQNGPFWYPRQEISCFKLKAKLATLKKKSQTSTIMNIFKRPIWHQSTVTGEYFFSYKA